MVSPSELRAALVQLRSRVDDHFEAATRRTPDAYACAEGCETCCHQRFSVFEVEAVPVREALARLAETDPALRQRVREQATDPDHNDRCALLVDGRCAVYDARPMICRSHGLPVAVRRADGETELDCCPLNFRGEVESESESESQPPSQPRRFSPTPPPASVLRLDAVNQPLALLAELWREANEPAPLRVELAQLAALRAPSG